MLKFQTNGIFGYDCRGGICDFIPIIDNGTRHNAATILSLMAKGIACFVVICSYSYIGWYFVKNHKHLKTLQTVQSYTTFSLFLAFLFHVMVLTLRDILYYFWENQNSLVDVPYKVSLLLYYLPYCTNCFIYSLSSQYRKSYVYFLKSITGRLLQNNGNAKSELTTGDRLVTVGH